MSQPALPQDDPAATPSRSMHRDLDAALLEEPGGGQSDHAGADDGDPVGGVVGGLGDGVSGGGGGHRDFLRDERVVG